MDEALRALLVADAAVNAEVAGRVYWDTAVQGSAKPSIVLYPVSGVPDYHMQGPSGLVESRVQIDCRATTRTGALALARKVEAVLSGLRTVESGIKFNGIFKVNARSSFEDTGAETFFVNSADYQVWSGLAA